MDTHTCDSCAAVAAWHACGHKQYFCIDHGYPGTPAASWDPIRRQLLEEAK